MSLNPKDALVALIPNLRAFAMTLSNDPASADDLVQDTLVKAWDHFDSFQEGTNLKAWLFTILRNTFLSDYRKRKRQFLDSEGYDPNTIPVPPEQEGHIGLQDLSRALKTLPAEQREAVILVGAAGFSYEEAAEVCGCAVGTIKSRVNRARHQLAKMIGESSDHDLGPDFAADVATARVTLTDR